jgi:hypothetical protein
MKQSAGLRFFLPRFLYSGGHLMVLKKALISDFLAHFKESVKLTFN